MPEAAREALGELGSKVGRGGGVRERGEVAEGVVHHSVEVVGADQPEEEGRLEGRLRDGLRRVGLGMGSG